MTRMLAALVLAAAALATTVAPAQEVAADACSAPEYRQMDFWVGEWDLEYDRPDGTVGTAVNSITQGEFGRCAIIERFRMPNGYSGSSYSMYDRDNRVWRQLWIDNQGETFALTGGPAAGADHVFALATTHPSGPDKVMKRMIWQDVAPDRLTWRWQARQADGGWKDLWVLRYRRRPG